MHIPIHRRTAIAAGAGLALAVALVVGASASPEPEAGAPTTTTSEVGPADIARIDAEARARAVAGEALPVYDTGLDQIVEVPQEDYAAAQRDAAAVPGYLDANGNPNYLLVWSNGRFVPGPTLECVPSEGDGPATCTVADE